MDLRSSSIPGSGLEYSGAYRKKKRAVVMEEEGDEEKDGDEEEGDMKVEKAPRHKPIGKFVRTKKPVKKSKKIITF